MAFRIEKLKRIDVPARFPNRAAVYDLATLESVLINKWESVPGFRKARKDCWCALNEIPLYISVNSQRPNDEAKAKIGVCLVINMGKGELKERVKAIILPILRKHWPEMKTLNQNADFWTKQGIPTQADVNELQKVLVEEIEPALFSDGILIHN